MLSASLIAGLLLAAGPVDPYVLARDSGYAQDYAAAGRAIDRQRAIDPDDPAVSFWQAAMLQLQIYDLGNRALVDSFYRLSDRSVAASKKRLRENPDDARAHLYLGMTQLNRANCQSWQNSKLRAFMTMLGVPGRLNRCLESESTATDAMFGVGVIEYFKAAADRYLFGLGLIGSRERAYRMVRAAADSGGIFRPMAQFLLGFMLKEDGEYIEAVEVCRRLLQQYPGNRSARRLLRDVCLDMGDYHRALEIGIALEQEILAQNPDNRYGIAENRLKCGKAWIDAGEPDSARLCLDRIIAWEPYKREVPWLPSYIRDAKKLRADLTD